MRLIKKAIKELQQYILIIILLDIREKVRTIERNELYLRNY